MGLNRDDISKIKGFLDIEEGGRLRAIGERAEAADAPILIIGLGGTGIDSLLVTKKRIYDRIVREKKADGTYADKPRNIEYLGIDISEDIKDKKYQGLGLNYNAGEAQVYAMPHVQPIMKHPDLLPEYVNNWLDTSIKTEQLFNGAGAVRQLGRLLLMQNIGSVITVLENKIRKLTADFAEHTSLEVFIVTSICGGTGGGMFIDMPYLVRSIAKKLGVDRVNVYGMLFLPDVLENKIKQGRSNSETLIMSLRANGFAALKELDYLMDDGDQKEDLAQRYDPEFRVEMGKERPYDVCLLLSCKDQNGEQPAPGEGYRQTVQMVAETICHLILADTGAKGSYDMSLRTLLENTRYHEQIDKRMLGDQSQPVPYVYLSAGVSLAKLPMDDLMSYLAYRMYREVEDFWERQPEAADIEAAENYFHLSKGMIWAEATADCPSAETTDITRKVVKNEPERIVQLFEEKLEEQKAQISENRMSMEKRLLSALDDDNNLLVQCFHDLEKGPAFVRRCLYDTAHRCLLGDLQEYRLLFSGSLPMSDEQMNTLLQETESARQRVCTSLLGGRAVQAYLKSMHALYTQKRNQFAYEQIAVFCEDAALMLWEKYQAVYDAAGDLLCQLMPIFKGYGSLAAAAADRKTDPEDMLSWFAVDAPTLISRVEAMMNADPAFAVDFREVAQNFYSYLYQNSLNWKDGILDAVDELQAFFYRQFEPILGQGMDFFLEQCAQAKGELPEQYDRKLLAKLTAQAQVRYPIDEIYAAAVSTEPEYLLFIMPGDAPKLLGVTKEYAGTYSDTGYYRYQYQTPVRTCAVRDHIFMMRCRIGMPLFLNADLKGYYKAYMPMARSVPGMHLYVPTKVGAQISDIDWRLLPSPYPESVWMEFFDPEEHAINEHYREVLRKALAYGYVRLDKRERTMTLYFCEPVDVESIAAACSIDLAGSPLIAQRSATRFAAEVGKQLEKEMIQNPSAEEMSGSVNGKGRCQIMRTCPDLLLNQDGTIKESYAQMRFIRLYRMRRKIACLVENHEAALAAVEAVKGRVIDLWAVECYVKCRITGLISDFSGGSDKFVYLDPENKEVDLGVLDEEQMAYQEYYILKSFRALSADTREMLEAHAQEILDTGEDKEGARKKLQAYRKELIDGRLEDLKWEYALIEEGEAILDIYRKLKKAVNELQEQMDAPF